MCVSVRVCKYLVVRVGMWLCFTVTSNDKAFTTLELCITRGTQALAQRCVDATHTHQLHRYGTHKQTRVRTRTHTYAQVVIISEREDRGTSRQLEKALQEALRINCLCLTSSLRSGKEWEGKGEKSVGTRVSRSRPHERTSLHRKLNTACSFASLYLSKHTCKYTPCLFPLLKSQYPVVDAAVQLQRRAQNVGAESRSTSCTIDLNHSTMT